MGHDNEVKDRKRKKMSAVPQNAIKKVKKGDIIFREGENPGAMYLIRTGMIRVFKKKGDSQIEIDTLRAGGVVGEMAFLDGNPRSASAEALMDTEMVEISTALYSSTMEKIPEWVKILIKAIVGKLRSTTTKVKNLEQASTEVTYGDKGSERRSVFLSSHDCLKIATALQLVGMRSTEDTPEGKRIKPSTMERYATQVIGIPLAKVTTFLEILKQAGFVNINEATQELALKDPQGVDAFIQFVCDENMLEPAKRHDMTIRGYLIMGLMAKHMDRFPKDPSSGMSQVNIAMIRKLEMEANGGKEPFRMDEVAELTKLGFSSQLNVISTDEQTVIVQTDSFKKIAKVQRVLKLVDAANEEKTTSKS